MPFQVWGLPFVSLTDVRDTRINLFPSAISSASEETVQCAGMSGQSPVLCVPGIKLAGRERECEDKGVNHGTEVKR